MDLISHVLNHMLYHMLDHMIIDPVIIALHKINSTIKFVNQTPSYEIKNQLKMIA